MSVVVPNDNTVKDCLSVSILNQQKRILKPTKCPTESCEECKINYIDKYGLNILVICKCNCHKTIKILKRWKKLSIISSYKEDETLQYRIEELLISNSIFDRINKTLIASCIIKKYSSSTIALLDDEFFEKDIYLFYILKELKEEEISILFIPAFKGVFNFSIDKMMIIKWHPITGFMILDLTSYLFDLKVNNP